MNHQNQNFDLIEGHLEGRLNKEQQHIFQEKLAGDPLFAEEVTQTDDLIKTIRLAGQIKTKATIQKVAKQLRQEGFFNQTTHQAKVKRLPQKVWWVASAAAIVFLLAWWVWQPPSYQVPQALAAFETFEPADYNKIYEELTISGFVDEKQDQRYNLLKIRTLIFDKKQYGAAESLLKFHFEKYSGDLVAQLFAAINFNYQGKLQKAIEQLKPLTDKTDFRYQNLALWWLSKSYLMQEPEANVAAAIPILEQLEVSDMDEYAASATEILRQLKGG